MITTFANLNTKRLFKGLFPPIHERIFVIYIDICINSFYYIFSTATLMMLFLPTQFYGGLSEEKSVALLYICTKKGKSIFSIIIHCKDDSRQTKCIHLTQQNLLHFKVFRLCLIIFCSNSSAVVQLAQRYIHVASCGQGLFTNNINKFISPPPSLYQHKSSFYVF